ncbi:MAG: TrkH family potassium uptake protein [Sphingomonadaceae bacterium]
MRPTVVVHYLGSLLVLMGGLMLVPFGVSVLYGESDRLALLTSALITAAVGGTAWVLTRKQPGPMMRKESFLVVALGWALASAFGALPYMLAGTFTSFVDAYFEAMSGFTTTGSSVLADIEAQPHGILLWRGFTQWLGGMGIIALFIALVPLTRIGAAGASSLFEDEAPAPQVDRVTPRIRDTAKALWVIYSVMTLALVILLVLVGMPLFDSIANTFGTMATGGFSPRNASIAYYRNPAAEWIIVAFMALAGTNFGLYYLMWRGKIRKALADTELKVYFAILAGCSLLVAIDLMANAGYTSFLEAIRFSSFQVVSQQTTTGFMTADFDQWPWFSKTILLLVMFIGASSGSTGGALKVVRLVIVSKYAHRQLYNVFHPRVVLPIKMGGRVVPEGIVRESVAFFIVYQSIFLFSTIALTALGIDFISALSGVAATLGNVGPGLAMVGPTMNFSPMPDLAKVIFTFDMYVGRLELWTVLILLRPAFWREP